MAAKLFRRHGSMDEVKLVGGSAISYHPKGKLQNAIIGYSGCVADELCLDFEQDADEIWSSLDLDYELESDALSPTDLRCLQRLNYRFHWNALSTCVDILKSHWEYVHHVANKLLREFKANPDEGIDRCFSCYFTPLNILPGSRKLRHPDCICNRLTTKLGL